MVRSDPSCACWRLVLPSFRRGHSAVAGRRAKPPDRGVIREMNEHPALPGVDRVSLSAGQGLPVQVPPGGKHERRERRGEHRRSCCEQCVPQADPSGQRSAEQRAERIPIQALDLRAPAERSHNRTRTMTIARVPTGFARSVPSARVRVRVSDPVGHARIPIKPPDERFVLVAGAVLGDEGNAV